jgi:hypothetical protein
MLDECAMELAGGCRARHEDERIGAGRGVHLADKVHQAASIRRKIAGSKQSRPAGDHFRAGGVITACWSARARW